MHTVSRRKGPQTKLGSRLEHGMGAVMIGSVAVAPVAMIATGTAAGVLALPLIGLAPLAFLGRQPSVKEKKQNQSERTEAYLEDLRQSMGRG